MLFAYTILTPTNVLLGLLAVTTVLAGARVHDRDTEQPLEQGGRRK